MKTLDKTIDNYIANGIIEHIAVRVGIGDRIIYETFRGGAEEDTLFDMASVTKIVATTSLALIAIEKGLIGIDDPVSKYYSTDKPMTVRNMLTHTVGIGHKALNFEGYTYENIAEKILAIPSDIPIGSDVLYSCPGFILLGKILEKVFGKRIDICFSELVAEPLGMENTSFLPKNRNNSVNSNLNEAQKGIVNDYNCQFLGGVAGNAGIFSTLTDMTKYVGSLLRKGAPLISEKTFEEAVKNHTAGMSEARGLGFSYVDGKNRDTLDLFSDGAIGHCGHTGQSVFVDYRTGFYTIILSDSTISTIRKYGKENYDEVIEMRRKLHKAIGTDLGAKN